MNLAERKRCRGVTPEPPDSFSQRHLVALSRGEVDRFVGGFRWWRRFVKGSILGSSRTASSSGWTLLTFCTDDVILCMRDFVFCVSALVSAGFWRLRLPCCFPALRWLDLSAVSAFLTGRKIVCSPRANKTVPPLIFCDLWPVVFVSEAWKAFYRQENVELCTIKFLL